MIRQRTALISQRTAFLLVFGLVTVVLVGSSLGLVTWVFNQLRPDPPAAAPSIYTDYDPAGTYLRPESLEAMAAYIAANPEPQNVQVLNGMNTAQIANYMVSQVSGGLKVDCSYCHILTNGNFAEDGNPQKTQARQMMGMVADLNQNYVSTLQQSVGTKQITCATCHNGQPVFAHYPQDQSPLPDDFVLPLDLEYPGGLALTGEDDPNLNEVQLNQYTMSHFNQSLGVGCAFCHNANYFPSYEVPAKNYAQTMLQMTQHINNQYKEIMNNKDPSCYMCHQGNQLPPGSANRPEDVPPMLSTNPPAAMRKPTTCTLCHPAEAAVADTAGKQN